MARRGRPALNGALRGPTFNSEGADRLGSRAHPGAFIEELYEALRPRYDVGLVVVVWELKADGRIALASDSVAGRIYATMEACP